MRVAGFPIKLSLRAGKVADMHALLIHRGRNIDGWGVSGKGCALFVVLCGI